MKILGFRHFGIPTENMGKSIIFFEKAGFKTVDEGDDVIDGVDLHWIKMSDGKTKIELINGGPFHMSFTVDQVVPEHYYYQSPRGHKVQFGMDPNGIRVEFVQEADNG